MTTKSAIATQEFDLFFEAASEMWDSSSASDMKEAMMIAFNAGLSDGRAFMDSGVVYELNKVLKDSGEIEDPLSDTPKYSAKGNYKAFYDTAFILNQWLRSVSHELNYNYYDYYSYRESTGIMMRSIGKTIPFLDVSPKMMSEKSEQAIILEFKGLELTEAGSYSTIERIAPSYVNHSYEHQGMSYCKSLLSATYSHGLYLAQMANTKSVIDSLLPVYEEAIESPDLNLDNGPEILEMIGENKYIQFLIKIESLEFSSTYLFENPHEQVSKSKRIDGVVSIIKDSFDSLPFLEV